MERLRMVTEEERALLAGGGVERERYATGSGFTVDREKLLEKGKLITMRPHTRFTRFPRHSHNYVEICICAAVRRCIRLTARLH
ncbi:MAG: hypothetical protein ACLRJV_03560 [Eubacteriales bacterium]